MTPLFLLAFIRSDSAMKVDSAGTDVTVRRAPGHLSRDGKCSPEESCYDCKKEWVMTPLFLKALTWSLCRFSTTDLAFFPRAKTVSELQLRRDELPLRLRSSGCELRSLPT